MLGGCGIVGESLCGAGVSKFDGSKKGLRNWLLVLVVAIESGDVRLGLGMK